LPEEPCIRWSPDHPTGRGSFEGKSAAHCKVYGRSAVSCAKTAELTVIQFGLRIQVGPRNRVFNGVQIPNVKEQFLWETACQAGQGMPGDTLL